MSKIDFRYYFITDRKQCSGRPLAGVVREACLNGIRAVQLREKDLPARDLYTLAKEIREITAEHDARLFINDRVDIAIAVEADGVHCREDSIWPSDIKKINSDLKTGVSVHSIDRAQEAQKDGADFVLFGPVFKTPSKEKYGTHQGIERLKEVIRAVDIPVFAVGGITTERAHSCFDSGVWGVAGISSVMSAESVEQKVKEWNRVLETYE